MLLTLPMNSLLKYSICILSVSLRVRVPSGLVALASRNECRRIYFTKRRKRRCCVGMCKAPQNRLTNYAPLCLIGF